jgi:tRNA(fMet)-specific endonuclease VapC
MTISGYLLDTCLISALLDPTKTNHSHVVSEINSLEDAAPKYVSVITLAELYFGSKLARLRQEINTERIDHIISNAKSHLILDVTKHTSEEYGIIKSEIADKYLDKLLKKEKRPRWIEEWVDKATGNKLQIDENDLWLTAQAKERNLILLTTEVKIHRISKAVATVNIKTV